MRIREDFSRFFTKEASSSSAFANLLQALKESGDLRLIDSLARPSGVVAAVSILFDYCLIVSSTVLAWWNPWLLPLSLIVVGSRQRALYNLLHDAAHYNLFKSPRLNDGIANLFLALPLFDTLSLYRSGHFEHHRFLGHPAKDPDSTMHRRYGYEESAPPKVGFFRLAIHFLFNRESWRDAFLNNWTAMSPLERSGAVAVISVCALFASISIRLSAAWFLPLLWFVAKATTFHVFRLTLDLLDHTGLPPGDLFQFTRNLPHNHPVNWFIRPHQNSYHLTHHVFPRIPFCNLSKADRILRNYNVYRDSHHCDGYVWGSHTVIRCWTGVCRERRAD